MGHNKKILNKINKNLKKIKSSNQTKQKHRDTENRVVVNQRGKEVEGG